MVRIFTQIGKSPEEILWAFPFLFGVGLLFVSGSSKMVL